MSKNLWGEISTEQLLRTPTSVLREQATALTKATKAILEGHVRVSSRDGLFAITLSIVAPTIDNYEFDVVYATHGVDLYPVTVAPDWDRYSRDAQVDCDDEDELLAALEKILGSSRVQRVIKSLLAQSKSM